MLFQHRVTFVNANSILILNLMLRHCSHFKWNPLWPENLTLRHLLDFRLDESTVLYFAQFLARRSSQELKKSRRRCFWLKRAMKTGERDRLRSAFSRCDELVVLSLSLERCSARWCHRHTFAIYQSLKGASDKWAQMLCVIECMCVCVLEQI